MSNHQSATPSWDVPQSMVTCCSAKTLSNWTGACGMKVTLMGGRYQSVHPCGLKTFHTKWLVEAESDHVRSISTVKDACECPNSEWGSSQSLAFINYKWPSVNLSDFPNLKASGKCFWLLVILVSPTLTTPPPPCILVVRQWASCCSPNQWPP